MPAIPNVYRRGGLYWFRSNLSLFSGRSVDIRFSLQTACARAARRLAAGVRASVEGVQAMLNEAIMRQKTIPDSTLSAIGRRAYDDLLGHLRATHAQELNRGTSIRLNRCITDMFWLLRLIGRPFALTDEILDALRDHHGWDEQRLDDLVETFETYEDGKLALNDDRIAGYLAEHRLAPSPSNMIAAGRTMLPYYHDAARQAHARLCVGGSTHPLRDEPVGTPAGEMATLLRALQANAAPAAVAASAPPVAASPETPAMRISEVVEKFVVDRADELGSDSLGQVRKAADLFIFENGDLRIDEVKQAHLGAAVGLMKKLPVHYGRTKEELEGGLTASVARGKEMKDKEEGKVGLSQVTINKHLTWIDALFSHARVTLGFKPAEELNFKDLRKSGASKKQKVRKNAKRLSWTDDELLTMFSAAVWSGSAGLFDRLQPGKYVWHDAWYFLPLAMALHGTRSEEFSGLSLDEVHEDAPIPFISLRDTRYRKLKNIPSIRDIPISPELIRLGFIDYVRALRSLGEQLVFPELHSPARTMKFNNVFYKQIFSKLRAHFFPEGTEWFKRNGGLKEKDVHSLRGSNANLLLGKVADSVRQDVLGHAGDGETRQTYDEAAELALKLEAIEKLSFLTAHIPARPLNLRPKEWLRYGQPLGRKVNGGRPVPRRAPVRAPASPTQP